MYNKHEVLFKIGSLIVFKKKWFNEFFFTHPLLKNGVNQGPFVSLQQVMSSYEYQMKEYYREQRESFEKLFKQPTKPQTQPTPEQMKNPDTAKIIPFEKPKKPV